MTALINLDQNQRDLLARLRTLKLYGMAQGLQIQWSTLSVYGNMSFDDRLRDLVTHQENTQTAAKAAYLTKVAKFKAKVDYDDIYANPDRGFSQELKLELASLNFIHKGTNILVQGSSGSGKSTLVCAIGRLCCSMGISTLYYNARDLLDELHAADYSGKRRLRSRIKRARVLILDDLGLHPLNQELALELFNILEDRVNSGVCIVSTQLSIQGLAKAMDCNMQTIDANMRRITWNAIKIELKGDVHRMSNKGILPEEQAEAVQNVTA